MNGVSDVSPRDLFPGVGRRPLKSPQRVSWIHWNRWLSQGRSGTRKGHPCGRGWQSFWTQLEEGVVARAGPAASGKHQPERAARSHAFPLGGSEWLPAQAERLAGTSADLLWSRVGKKTILSSLGAAWVGPRRERNRGASGGHHWPAH